MRARAAILVILVLSVAPLAAQYIPPACQSGQEVFDDVPASDLACGWIQKLWRDGIVDGCAPSRYCPNAPVTRRQAAVLIEKSMRDHLWGEGRPNSALYGRSPLLGLCDGTAGVEFGLSHSLATWGDARSACPSAYWVCTVAELGESPCNTNRPDSSFCDRGQCGDGCIDDDDDDHWGWLADASDDPRFGWSRRETTTFFINNASCLRMPVWCCRDR